MSQSVPDTATSPLSVVFGANAKVEILSYLANESEPKRQVEIADAIDVSEATISRAKEDLIGSGFLEQTNGRLRCAEGVEETIRTLESQL